MRVPEFKLRPSTTFFVIFLTIMLVSVGILIFISLPFWLKVIGVIVVLGYGMRLYQRYIALSSADAIIGLQYQANGWLIQTQCGWQQATLCGDSTVTSMISVLRFTIKKQKYPVSCIVFRDSLAPDLYRQLLVTIKWS